MTFRDTQNMFNRITKSEKNQDNRQKFVGRVIAIAFLTQAIIIGIKGNLDVLSGKPVLDVIPSMITQAIQLIVKTHRAQKSAEEIDRIKKDRTAQNPDD
jgi:ubiquinone biosynthesis protein UbiJ